MMDFISELLLGVIEISRRRPLLIGVQKEIDNRIGLLLRNAPFLEALSDLASVFEKRHGKRRSIRS
jgi:hypothetical protein